MSSIIVYNVFVYFGVSLNYIQQITTNIIKIQEVLSLKRDNVLEKNKQNKTNKKQQQQQEKKKKKKKTRVVLKHV